MISGMFIALCTFWIVVRFTFLFQYCLIVLTNNDLNKILIEILHNVDYSWFYYAMKEIILNVWLWWKLCAIVKNVFVGYQSFIFFFINNSKCIYPSKTSHFFFFFRSNNCFPFTFWYVIRSPCSWIWVWNLSSCVCVCVSG